MRDVDSSTGHVLVDYIISCRYNVDYDSAEEDENIALREYIIALKAWAVGRRLGLQALAAVKPEILGSQDRL
jgi:hypothetical protein